MALCFGSIDIGLAELLGPVAMMVCTFHDPTAGLDTRA